MDDSRREFYTLPSTSDEETANESDLRGHGVVTGATFFKIACKCAYGMTTGSWKAFGKSTGLVWVVLGSPRLYSVSDG
ncbi:hypothetical protein P3T25_005646 [Paraburkholderia sp. GAS32]